MRRANVFTYVYERAARHAATAAAVAAAAVVRFPSPPFLSTLATVRKRNVTSDGDAYAGEDEDEDTGSHEDSGAREHVDGDSFTWRSPRLSIREDDTA